MTVWAMSAVNAVVASVLLYAAMVKLARPDQLRRALSELAGDGSRLAGTASVRAVATAELLAGAGLTVHATRGPAAFVVAALGLVFTVAGVVGVARRGVEPCGCLGAPRGRPLGPVNVLIGLAFVAVGIANTRTPATDVPAVTASILAAVREDLAATNTDDPARAALAWEYAELLRRHPDDATHRVEARALLADAVRQPGPTPSLHRALRAATRLGELAGEAGDAGQALLGYRRAVELLPTAAWPGLRRAVREARLADAPRATDAAAQAVNAAEPRVGVELLESGRSVMWSQQLNLRTDQHRLREAAPELADRMNGIRGWLERPTMDA